MKRQIFTLLLILLSTLLFCQAPAWTSFDIFESDGEDKANAIVTDAAGNVYVTGAFYETMEMGSLTLNSTGIFDAFVTKYDSDGNVIWVKTFPSTSLKFAVGQDIALDPAGNVLVIGSFIGTMAVDTINLTVDSTENYDAFIAKMTPDGQVLWANNYGTIANDYGEKIATDGQGNCYAIMQQSTYGNLYKIDSNGQILDDFGNFQLSFTNLAIKDSLLYVIGEISNTAILGPDTLEVPSFIAQSDLDFNFQWARGQRTCDYIRAHDLAVNNEGAVFLTWEVYCIISYYPDFYIDSSSLNLSKYSISGDQLFWLRTEASYMNDVKIALDGQENLTWGGNFRFGTLDFGGMTPITGENAFLLKVDGTTGDILHQATPNAGSHALAASGNVIYRQQNTTYNIFEKMDSLYNTEWEKIEPNYSGGSGWRESKIITDKYGNFYVLDHCYGACRVKGYQLEADSAFVLFVAKFNAAKQLLWVTQFDSKYSIQNTHITTDVEGNVIFIGKNTNPVYHNGVMCSAEWGSFIAKLNPNGELLWTRIQEGNVAEIGGIQCTWKNIIITGTIDGTLMFNGQTMTESLGNVFVLKYDSDGNILWTRQLGNSSYNKPRIAADVDNNIFLTLYSSAGSISFNGISYDLILGEGDIILIKMSPYGETHFVKNFGGGVDPSQDNDAMVRSIHTDKEGNVFLLGKWGQQIQLGNSTFLNSNLGTSDNLFIAKMDTNGDFLWSNKLETKSLGYYDTYDLAIDNQNNVYYGGYNQDSIFIGNTDFSSDELNLYARFNPDGSLVWVKKSDFGSSYSIAAKGEDNLMIYGTIGGDYAQIGGEVFFFRHNAFLAELGESIPVSVIPIANESFALSVFPNPTTGQLRLEYLLEASTPIQLLVYDVLGRVMYNRQLGLLNKGLHRQIVDISSLPSGSYVLSLKTNTNFTSTIIEVK